MKTKKNESRKDPGRAANAIAVLVGVVICLAACYGLNKVITHTIQAKAQQDAWVQEYDRRGPPLVVKMPALGINQCHDLLLRMKSAGFSIEIDGREANQGNDMVNACRWFKGSPTLTLTKPSS
ncbi:hypothetical protein [Pseudomonas amygdali]|uniref:Uncharacterized protein n=1 Tax=Pseudomonas amygdali pv. lachrymans str. M301315 TaxID=629260 RepID=A0AAD0PX15_PSEAV|nr:hypothetical protein [Pseudomonas amygdali]AXH60303.1 hypothetical protein PLA107_034545 [Pseudomonas amygdali pv. lachrymans str. M301315]